MIKTEGKRYSGDTGKGKARIGPEKKKAVSNSRFGAEDHKNSVRGAPP